MTLIEKIISFPSNGKKLRMCIHEKHNAFNVNTRNPGAKPGFGGFEGDLLQVLLDALGVDFDYYVPYDDGFGIRLDNNTWTGCPGMVQRNETDVALGAMLQNYWSSLFAHASVSYRSEEVRFITKLPDPVTKPEVIIKTFDTDLWITILIFIFLIAFVFYWIHGRKYSFADQCFSRVAELLLQEPVVKIEKKFSQELLCLFWSVTVQFITLAYMAVILGIMMLPKRPPSLDNDEKLIDAVKLGKYKAATPSDLEMYLDNLVNSPLSKYQYLGNMIRKNNWILDINQDNFASLLKSDYALASAIASRKMYNPPGFQIVISDDFINTANLCALISKSSPLKKRIDAILTGIVEHGIYYRDLEIFIFKTRLKLMLNEVPETELSRALNLNDFQGTFMLLGMGVGTSQIVLICEIISFKMSGRFQKKCFEKESETG